jgi:type IX secretion system substrate protein
MIKSSVLSRLHYWMLAASFVVLSTQAIGQLQEGPAKIHLKHRLHAGTQQIDQLKPLQLKDSIRVLALMVEFLEDDDSRTSGTGKFGTIYPVDYGGEILDPYPHDREFFRNHLTFLENYVKRASAERTIVSTSIMPNIVTVPGKMQDYSPRRGETNKSVADFTLAAWTVADAAHPGFDFSAYDMFVIFHAGRGNDVDLTSIQGSNPTPFDLPSLSFTLNAYKEFYGSEYSGIPVSGASFTITNTSVIPTTDNREIDLITGDRALLELTTNGLLAASFGTYAGLPDLFDTKNGTTGIGRFGLMDAEAIFAYGGICPPAPSAWEKVMLGWAIPSRAFAGSNDYILTAQRTDQPSSSDILQVPITGEEYWLLENRHRDPAGNGQTVTMVNSGTTTTLTFPKDTTGFQNSDVSALKGVIVDVEDFDWSLPGGSVQVDETTLQGVNGGILIWHIDEVIIEQNLATNSVNADRDMRGVDLEQAGGSQDIGETIGTVFGDVTQSGSPLDYWFKGNIAPLYNNVFGARTFPDTRSNAGAFSHIMIDQFGNRGPLMSLRVSLGDDIIASRTGYPFDVSEVVPGESNNYYVQTADVQGDTEHELFIAVSSSDPNTPGTDTGFVIIRTLDGNSLLPSSVSGIAIAEPGIQQWDGAPLVGDITSDGNAEVIVYGKLKESRRISVYSIADGNNDGLLDLLRSFETDDLVPISPIIHNGSLVFKSVKSNSADSLIILNQDLDKSSITSAVSPGNAYSFASFPGEGVVLLANKHAPELIQLQDASKLNFIETLLHFGTVPENTNYRINCIVSDFDGDGREEGAAVGEKGVSIISATDDQETGFGSAAIPSSIPLQFVPPHLSTADVDGDGRNDLLISDSDRMFVLNYALASVDYYPTNLSASYALSVRFPGQDRDAVFVVGEGQLSQLATRARQADGFPIPLPRNASVTLFPSGSGSKQLSLAVLGDDGRLFVYDTPNQVDDNSFVWRSRFADERNSNYGVSKSGTNVSSGEFFPLDRCYNWPNPCYEQVTKIRYYVSEDANITIKIYDLAGDKVDEIHASAVGGTDNEVDWNVSEIQSGVYLAQVEAVAGGLNGSKIIKVAIVK